MSKIKAKLTALFMSACCLACVGVGVALSQPKNENVVAKAATEDELTAEFTNNGQFTIGQFKDGMSHEILDSTAKGVPEGASGAVLKITGTGDIKEDNASGAFATLDFSASNFLITGVDIIVKVYQPGGMSFRASKTAGSAEWKTQVTPDAGWSEVTLSAATNATEDHQILTTISMGFRRGTECYIDSITVVDNDLKKDFTNDGQFEVKQYNTNRTLYVDGATEGLEGCDGAVLKIWTGGEQYATLDFSGSGLKASDVVSMFAKCYLPYALEDKDGNATYGNTGYEFRLNGNANTSGGAGAYDMSTWFDAAIDVSKIATDANGYLTTVTIGLRNKGKDGTNNNGAYFYIDSITVNMVEYTTYNLGALTVHPHSAGTTTNPPSATALYMASSVTLPFTTWQDKFNLESGDGFKLNGNAVTTGQLVSADKSLYVSLADANVQVGDVLSVSGTFVHTSQPAKYVIEESKFVWDGVAWENYEDYTKEYTTQECGSLKFSSWTADKNFIYLARADGVSFTVPADNNNGWTALFRAKLGVGVTLNGKLIKNLGNQIKFPSGNMFININGAFAEGEGPVEGDVLTVGGTFYNTSLAIQYKVTETSFTWNGTTWVEVTEEEPEVEYSTYTVTKIGVAGTQAAENIYVYSLGGDELPKDQGDWSSVYTLEEGSGAGVLLNEVALTGQIKMPSDLYVPLGKMPETGDALTLDGTLYNEAKAIKLVFDNCKLTFNGEKWVEYIPPVEYSTYTVTKIGGYKDGNAIQLYSLGGDELPKNQGDWDNVYSYGADASVKLNDTEITASIKMPGDLYVPLGTDAQVGDIFTINGTFYNEAKAIKLVFVNCQLYWDGSAWTEENPNVVVTYVSSVETYTEKVVKGQAYTLATVETTKTFIGWANNGTLYKAGAEFEVTSAVTFTAVEIDFTMEDGASIRIGNTAASSGIRFTSQFNKAEFDALIGQYGIASIAYGTLIMPYDYLDTNQEQKQEPNLTGFDSAKNEILKIESTPIETDDEYVVFRGAMQKLYEGNYGRLFAGRAYMKIIFENGDVWTVYTEFDSEDNVRSIRDIAKAFKNDTSEAEEGELRYNALSDVQKAVVDAYIGTTDEIEVANYAAYETNATPVIACDFPKFDFGNGYMNDAGIKVIDLTEQTVSVTNKTLTVDLATGAGVTVLPSKLD